MMATNILDIEQSWTSVSKVLFVPYTEAEYEQLVSVLDALLDTIGEDETHPLASLMDVIGVLIEQYEDEHVPELNDIDVSEVTE